MKNKVYILLIILFFLPLFSNVFAAGSAIRATVRITVCGNNVKETGEQCDNTDLGGKSCISLGFAGGTLYCGASCDFNTSSCTTAGGGRGGGGGGGGVTEPSITGVIFSGRAYPLSKVGILKDGQLVITTIAGPDSKFTVSLTGLSSGNYNFSVFSEDNNGVRSLLFTFPMFITSGATTSISGIFIAPTISVDKSEVKKGDNIAIFGQSASNSDVTISVGSEQEFLTKTKSDKNGIYLYNLDTDYLDMGQHTAKSKVTLNGEISSYGKVVGFTVGSDNVLVQLPEKIEVKSDLNGDRRVNLVDFSIAAYWYKRPNPPASSDLNKDGKVDLIDFSIMAYYWTG